MKRLQSMVDLPGDDAVEGPAHVPRLRVHLSDADEQQLVVRYSQGATLRQLATEFGGNREKVSLILQHHSVARRYHSTVDVDLIRAAELQADGLNLTEIANAMGVGRTTLVRARRASPLP